MNWQKMIKKIKKLTPVQRKDIAEVLIQAMNAERDRVAAMFKGGNQDGWKADRWRGYFTKLSKAKPCPTQTAKR